ncbi:predicted protein [Plenodomus lingam JN3]|uniref:Predicted protein n=1 Tax=Leptosphaeria maculans (strain JN3 / isolate v23.1.3 / race Av1-4-5-6-7-8) TaxID=985895 RepID=E4ZXM9_LEPMJ|nr:predicted protein [Plenodomus lingam JN3]CBX96124.1 predicted protein [Plenodomus lingam JN3]
MSVVWASVVQGACVWILGLFLYFHQWRLASMQRRGDGQHGLLGLCFLCCLFLIML